VQTPPPQRRRAGRDRSARGRRNGWCSKWTILALLSTIILLSGVLFVAYDLVVRVTRAEILVEVQEAQLKEKNAQIVSLSCLSCPPGAPHKVMTHLAPADVG
jgi:hypothetical protein